MAGGLTVSVRQIASYPQVTVAPGDLVLVQQGGLGGPYATASTYGLVVDALASGGSIGIGNAVPANAWNAGVFLDQVVGPDGVGILSNAYFEPSGPLVYYGTGVASHFYSTQGTFQWVTYGAGGAGQPVGGGLDLMSLNAAGALRLNYGTLTVARDPGSALEVATAGWVGANTVASFNGRRGVVTLSAADVYCALGLDPCDPFITVGQTNAAICSAIQQLLAAYPGVSTWNGRLGNVWMNVCDLNIATFSAPPGMPAFMVPTPAALDATPPPDGQTVVNIQWVENYIATSAGLATEAWVLAQIAAIPAGVTSFNARTGAVLLTLFDITNVGGAPLNGPNLSGVPTAPTAPVGTDTGQIATTAFVTAAVAASTAGVSSFNTRTGAVVLTLADVTGAGGAPITSPSFGGTPAAPTASPGTNTTQIATTQFVEAALGAQTLVSSFNGRSGAVVLTTADITGAGGAPVASPALTGNPTAPTPAPGDNDTSIATTAFVMAALGAAAPGVQSFNGRTGVVALLGNDISAAGGALLNSPAFSGTPSSTTPSAGDNSTRIATTAFVDNALATGAVLSVNGRTGAVTIVGADITGAGGALLNSPAFTGTPTGPTAAANTTTTQLATTAFVMNAINALPVPGVTSFNTRSGAVTLTSADVFNVGAAPLASPNFTGNPTGPTASPGTNSTQLATTAFVTAAIAALPATGVTSWNTRTGAVTLQANDISAVGGALLASPVFTGTPTAPTATAGTSTQQIATTAFVMAAIGGAGGVLSWNGRTGAVTLSSGDLSNVGGALLASPNFTGSPTAPTQATSDSSTLIATTAFVKSVIAALPAGVTSFNTRTGAVTFTTADLTAAGGATTAQLAGYLPLSGGTLTGPLTLSGGAPNTSLLNFSGSGGASANIGFGAAGTQLAFTVGSTTGFSIQPNGQSNFGSTITLNTGGNTNNIGGVATLTALGIGVTNNITAGGSVGAAQLTSTGTVNASGAIITSANVQAGQTVLVGQQNATQRNLMFGTLANLNWFFAWNAGTGRLQWIGSTGNNELMGIDANGNMGIAGTLSQGSDERSKGNIASFAPGVSVVAQLLPKLFTYNSDTATPQTEHLGFMAQDVQPVLAQAVTGSEQTSFGLDVTPILAACVNAIKQLLARVEALEQNASITPSAAQTA